MDLEFIERNQIVERYLSGKLPTRGAQDFERFCRENPTLLDALGLADRVNAGLRLLDASGKPEPWAETPRKPWEKLPFVAAVSAAAIILLVTSIVLGSKLANRETRIGKLQQQVAAQPLEPATRTRPLLMIPSRSAPSLSAAATVGGSVTEFADLKFDLSWSPFVAFRVTIDRADQGRVAVLQNLHKDSNGHLRMGFNSSALGPGNYQFTIEGLNWRGEPQPQAWITLGVAH